MKIIVPVIGLCVGILLGIKSGIVLPYAMMAYGGIGILACLDTVLGGVRADMEHQFQMRIFVSGFFLNGIVAIGLVWLGKQLNMDLSIAAIVVFGSRIFYNFSKIRRFLLNKRQKEAMIGEE